MINRLAPHFNGNFPPEHPSQKEYDAAVGECTRRVREELQKTTPCKRVRELCALLPSKAFTPAIQKHSEDGTFSATMRAGHHTFDWSADTAAGYEEICVVVAHELVAETINGLSGRMRRALGDSLVAQHIEDRSWKPGNDTEVHDWSPPADYSKEPHSVEALSGHRWSVQEASADELKEMELPAELPSLVIRKAKESLFHRLKAYLVQTSNGPAQAMLTRMKPKDFQPFVNTITGLTVFQLGADAPWSYETSEGKILHRVWTDSLVVTELMNEWKEPLKDQFLEWLVRTYVLEIRARNEALQYDGQDVLPSHAYQGDWSNALHQFELSLPPEQNADLQDLHDRILSGTLPLAA